MVKQCREVEQLAARRAHNPKDGGSNPSLATIFFVCESGGVAQSVRASES